MGGVFFLVVLKSGGDAAIHRFTDDVAHGIQLIGGDAAGGSLFDESPSVVIVPRRHADLSLCIGVLPSQPLAQGQDTGDGTAFGAVDPAGQ